MAPLNLEVLAAALGKAQRDNAQLKKGLQEVQALLSRNASGPKWVEDLPGKRVPFLAVISLTIAASDTSKVEGTYPASTDGPFICTGIAMFYQRTAGAYNGIWAPASTTENRIAPAGQNFGFGGIYDQPVVGSFDVEVAQSGSDRNWQNTAFASALFSPAVGGVYVLPISAVFGRNEIVIVRVTPTVSQPNAGKVEVILLGYKITQADSVQP